jgi:hypothetical protein
VLSAEIVLALSEMLRSADCSVVALPVESLRG